MSTHLQQYLEKGIECFYRSDYDSAAHNFKLILQHMPSHGKTWHYLGNVHAKQGNFTEAIACGERALQTDYHNAQFATDLGFWYLSDNQIDKALAQLKPYCELPDHIHLHDYLCSIYWKKGQLPESQHHGKIAAKASMNRFLIEFSNFKAAWEKKPKDIKLFQLVIQLKHCRAWLTTLKHSRFNLATAYITDQALELGWKHHESKEPNRYHNTLLRYKYWQGENLNEKVLLILPEQGLGDELLFSEPYSDIIKRAGHCLLCCDPRLGKLYQRSFPTTTIYPVQRGAEPWLEENKKIDYVTFSGSLLAHLRCKASDFKGQPWLNLDPAQCAYWKQKVDALPGKYKIGIAWRSRKNRNIPHHTDHYCGLSNLIPIFSLPSISYINLQYDSITEEISEFPKIKLYQFPELDLLRDIEATACLLRALNTSIMPLISTHSLAGAIGAEAYILHSSDPELAFCGFERSPFYPQLIAISHSGDWKPAISTLKKQLIQRYNG